MTVANEFLNFIHSEKHLDTARRPLRLLLGFSDGVRNDILLPQRVMGVEAICGGFTYTILALSTSAELPLKEFIALPAEINFVTDRGDIRRVCGIVSEASVGNSDGGVASYQLVIRDAFALMEKRINSRIFRSVRAAHSINLFAHRLGMKLIAASGNVAIQAHDGDIELTTPGRIKLHAGQGIELQAPDVKIVAQGAQADFGGGAITQQSSGPHAIKSSTFAHTQPGGASLPGVTFPSSGLEADERLVLFHQSTGKPIAGRRYRLDLEDGRVITGITDDQGRTELATSVEMGRVEFTIFPADEPSET